MGTRTGLEKVKCPYCGYEMPIFRSCAAQCKGLFVRCKGRSCGKLFEIKIETK